MDNPTQGFSAFAQGNFNAIMSANVAFMKGAEELSKNFFAVASRSMEEAVDVGKRLSTVKTFQEAIEIQTQYAQNAVQTLLAETKKAQELSATIATDISAPIVERGNSGMAAMNTAGNAAMKAAEKPSVVYSQNAKKST
jgi:phasin family protein